MYWENDDGETVDVQVIGTADQISTVHKVIKAIQERTRRHISERKVTVYLPKLYLRKILGYQNKHK